MNKIIISAVALATTFLVASCGGADKPVQQEVQAAATASGESVSMQIDPASSSVNWHAKKVTGEHKGTIKITAGELKTEQGKPVAGNFTIDMGSIAVGDIQDPVQNAKLTGHLKSDDFFSAEKHPQGKFEIVGVEAIDGAATGSPNYKIKGNLTIKGITNPIEFPAVIQTNENGLTASGDVELDRTLWDIRFLSGKFFKGLGDKVIYDTFSVKFDIKAYKG